MAVNKISTNTMQGILDKSAFGLPDSPRDSKMTASQVKRAFYKPIIDETNSLTSEVNRIVDEVNSEVVQGSTIAFYLSDNNSITTTKPTGQYSTALTLNGATYRQFPVFAADSSVGGIISRNNTYRIKLALSGLSTSCVYMFKVRLEANNDTVFETEKSLKPIAETDTLELLEKSILSSDIQAVGMTLAVSVKITEGTDGEITLNYGNNDNTFVLQNEKAISLPAGQVTTRAGDITRTQEELNKKMLKSFVRTATVVVGLESSGYTADEVDVLIKSGDSAQSKITEAISMLPSGGGEIKLLNGMYNVGTNGITISKENVMLSGCGSSTILSGANQFRVNATNCHIQNMQFIMTASSSNIIPNNSSKVFIDNCVGVICYKIADNWRNIFVNGVATQLISNTTQIIPIYANRLVFSFTPSVSDYYYVVVKNDNNYNYCFEFKYFSELINSFGGTITNYANQIFNFQMTVDKTSNLINVFYQVSTEMSTASLVYLEARRYNR